MNKTSPFIKNKEELLINEDYILLKIRIEHEIKQYEANNPAKKVPVKEPVVVIKKVIVNPTKFTLEDPATNIELQMKGGRIFLYSVRIYPIVAAQSV